MNKKRTLRALAGKWGLASGPDSVPRTAAASGEWLDWESRDPKARVPNPLDARRKSSRRVSRSPGVPEEGWGGIMFRAGK